MKSLKQISLDHGIAKSTLSNRIYSMNIKPAIKDGCFLYSKEQEEMITKPVLVKSSSAKLIREFAMSHTYLSAEEIANCLAIDLNLVIKALREELILESKLNGWNS